MRTAWIIAAVGVVILALAAYFTATADVEALFEAFSAPVR